MTKREIIAAALFIIGFILMCGAVGQLEFEKIPDYGAFWLRAGIGASLMAAAIPISGDIERGDNDRSRKNLREQNQEISRRK